MKLFDRVVSVKIGQSGSVKAKGEKTSDVPQEGLIPNFGYIKIAGTDFQPVSVFSSTMPYVVFKFSGCRKKAVELFVPADWRLSDARKTSHNRVYDRKRY